MNPFPAKHKRQSVVIVGDSMENTLILNEALSDLCEVIVATSGQTGLVLIFSHAPDLILLDVKMEDISGFEVCKTLRTDPRTEDIPIIFITSFGNEEEEKNGLLAGAIDYISKPFSLPVVRARVANHLRMKEQSDLLRNLSMTDGLTGLPNRRLMESYLDAEWRRCGRTSSPFSLVMIDIDYFKPFNDTYGHLQGDECLKAVAKALSTTLQRPGDIVARYGGEEFLCILPGIEIQGAVHLAEKMRQNVSSLRMPHKSSSVADIVTISAGAAMEKSCRDSRPDDLIMAADEQLYRAKESGRNCVMSSIKPA